MQMTLSSPYFITNRKEKKDFLKEKLQRKVDSSLFGFAVFRNIGRELKQCKQQQNKTVSSSPSGV
jgi:hypothetical protein